MASKSNENVDVIDTIIATQSRLFQSEIQKNGFVSDNTKFSYACALSSSHRHSNLELAITLFSGLFVIKFFSGKPDGSFSSAINLINLTFFFFFFAWSLSCFLFTSTVY